MAEHGFTPILIFPAHWLGLLVLVVGVSSCVFVWVRDSLQGRIAKTASLSIWPRWFLRR